ATAPGAAYSRRAVSGRGRGEGGPEAGGAHATVARTGAACGADAAGGSWVGQGELLSFWGVGSGSVGRCGIPAGCSCSGGRRRGAWGAFGLAFGSSPMRGATG